MAEVGVEYIEKQEAHERPEEHGRETSEAFAFETLGSHGLGGGCPAARCLMDGP